MEVPSSWRPRRRGPRQRSPARWYAALGPGADFVPAIADGVFEALPGVRMPCFPVAAGVRFQGDPVAPPVALVRAQLVAVAVRGLILRIAHPFASKRGGTVLPELVIIGRK